ncbi:MAG TPA: hypothetical protein VME19_20980 [Streptosporangiaceae bacterium]|nr:hypothetical protein [Streptosporangiaceae bacterium]
MSRRVITPIVVTVGVIAGGAAVARLLGYKLGTDVIVRCRQGHVFTTIWIPGVKLKALDLVVARVQRCPVGKHWSLVVPVRAADLTEGEREFARQHHDVRIP